MRSPRFVDLFAGIGGFHQAISSPPINGRCVLAVERDSAARLVYQHRFPETPIVEDIRAITQTSTGSYRRLDQVRDAVPAHDILCAGFPCQPFSKSGRQQGTSDRIRGTLFADILQIARARQPTFILLENVRNLAGPRHQDTYRTIVESLDRLGYEVERTPLVLSPHQLSPRMGGSPQIRERVFIPAVRKRHDDSRSLLQAIRQLEHATWSPNRWSISSILKAPSTKTVINYRLSGEEKSWLDAWNWLLREIPADELPGFPLWSDDFVVRRRFSRSEPDWKNDIWRKNSEFYLEYREIIDTWKAIQHGPLRLRIADFPRSRRKFEWQAREWQPRRRDRNIWDLLIHLRPSGIRVRPPTYTPALVAMAQTSIVGSQRRRLTPAECARLQGFSRDPYRGIDVPDSVKYRQLGNAVHVGLVRAISSRLLGLGDVA